MPSDEVLVALINESVNAKDRSRRVAAMVLVEVLRNGRNLGEPAGSSPVVIEPREAAGVAGEINALINKYHLRGQDAPVAGSRFSSALHAETYVRSAQSITTGGSHRPRCPYDGDW